MSWKAWLSWFVRSESAVRMGTSGRAGLGTGGAASGRAGLGTGGVAGTGRCLVCTAVSPVVTTVTGEVTADVLMTSLNLYETWTPVDNSMVLYPTVQRFVIVVVLPVGRGPPIVS
jgi:hypothetical protein